MTRHFINILYGHSAGDHSCVQGANNGNAHAAHCCQIVERDFSVISSIDGSIAITFNIDNIIAININVN